MSSPELILVVDDTPGNLEVVCETLSDAGYEQDPIVSISGSDRNSGEWGWHDGCGEAKNL